MNRLFCCLCLASAVATLGGLAGCSRQYYRTKADHEVYSILNQGNRDPRWKVEQPHITPDTSSRMYDPYHPDLEPMPTDDPEAHKKMHSVSGMGGAADWHDHGITQDVENPHWRAHLLLNEKGEVPLDKERAVELSILHSPEYQSARENLYLAAARVSQERFRYDVQFFGGDSILYNASGKLRGNNHSIQNNAYLDAQKMLASGGEWVVGLANSLTWQLGGKSSWQAGPLLNMSFTQPLLRGASRKVVLEGLTQQERNFLAALRQMVFYQQGHYARIVTGSGGQNTPSGTSDSSVQTFPRGFYGLLAEQISIQNQRQNIIGLEENLDRLEEIFEAGQIRNISQVEETRQSLLSAQSSLLARINSYQANIETYVRSLGLPPDLKVNIDDPLLEQFQLTSPTIVTLQEHVADLLTTIRSEDQPLPENLREKIVEFTERTKGEVAVLEEDLKMLETSKPERLAGLKNLADLLAERIRNGERINPIVYSTEIFEARINELQSTDIPQTLSRIQGIFTLLDAIVNSDEPALRQMIQEKSFSPSVQQALDDLNLNAAAAADVEADLILRRQELARITEELKELREKHESKPSQQTSEDIEDIAKRIEAKKIIEDLQKKDEYRDWIRRVVATFQYELISLSLMQTRTRLDAMTLVPVSISPEEAFQTASEQRLDWMNRKSQLVDTWRQIDITADRLLGDLNFTFEGEMGSIDKRGIRMDDDYGSLQVGLAWDTPLTRHNEMLEYRRSQISYQNERRNYYSYVDSVQANLQDILREVEMNRVEFEINRNAVLVGTTRVDVMQLQMEEPPQRGTTLDTNTAQQLINALNGLLESQNNLLETWVNYQTQRMLLDLNMGTMKLDDRGFWIDPGIIGSGSSDSQELAPIPVPILEIPKLNRRYVEEMQGEKVE